VIPIDVTEESCTEIESFHAKLHKRGLDRGGQRGSPDEGQKDTATHAHRRRAQSVEYRERLPMGQDGADAEGSGSDNEKASEDNRSLSIFSSISL
jgi:hypothetical protein